MPVFDKLEHRVDRHALLQPDAGEHAIALAIQTAVGRNPHGIADGLKPEHAARAAQLLQIQLAQLAVAQHCRTIDRTDPHRAIDAGQCGHHADRQACDRQRRALAIHQLHHATLGCQPYRIVVVDHDRADMPAGNALGLAVVAQHAPIAQHEHAIGIGAHPKIAAPVQRQAEHRKASPGWRDHRHRHDAPVRQHPVQAGGSGDPQAAIAVFQHGTAVVAA
ncbi:UNVERIFIED_ORG: hypothetical protein ABIB63_003579 [Xanthomonas axonopodis]